MKNKNYNDNTGAKKSSKRQSIRGQQRAGQYRARRETAAIIQTLDRYGQERQVRREGHMNTTTNLSIVEALGRQFQGRRNREIINTALRQDGLHTGEGEEREHRMEESWREAELAQREEQEAVLQQVGTGVLHTHGEDPGPKKEGIIRLIYENVNGIHRGPTGNKKIEKARNLHDELEVDIVAYNEHRINFKHKRNNINLTEIFKGGEAEIRTVAAHNVHENVSRYQEGGTAMMMFGPLIESLEPTGTCKDDSGLGRWVVMTVKGEKHTTKIVCGYNPCINSKVQSSTTYQQHRRYFITKRGSTKCPRTHFREDLLLQLQTWRDEGHKLIVCLDANEDIYKKSIGKALTDKEGLAMKEVVGDHTGQQLGATYFRGTKPHRCGMGHRRHHHRERQRNASRLRHR